MNPAKQAEDARIRQESHAKATKTLYDRIIDTLNRGGVAQLCT